MYCKVIFEEDEFKVLVIHITLFGKRKKRLYNRSPVSSKFLPKYLCDQSCKEVDHPF